MPQWLRKTTLVTHVAVSVGWLGAVVAFLALSIMGLTAKSAEVVRSAYFAMDQIGLLVIVPLSLASLVSGLVEALCTPWGLLRHYWVLSKLLITILATGLLLLHQFGAVESAARDVLGAAAGTLPSAGRLGIQLLVDASLATLALLANTALAVFKPRGLTNARPSIGFRVFLGAIGAIVVTFVAMHVSGLAGHHGTTAGHHIM
jgi:hypothetical protein